MMGMIIGDKKKPKKTIKIVILFTLIPMLLMCYNVVTGKDTSLEQAILFIGLTTILSIMLELLFRNEP